MSDQHQSWREVMPREERVQICRHIMAKLASYYQDAPEDTLKQRTRVFEAKAYSQSNSRDDYLNTIAGSLSRIEEHLQNQREIAQNERQQLAKNRRMLVKIEKFEELASKVSNSSNSTVGLSSESGEGMLGQPNDKGTNEDDNRIPDLENRRDNMKETQHDGQASDFVFKNKDGETFRSATERFQFGVPF